MFAGYGASFERSYSKHRTQLSVDSQDIVTQKWTMEGAVELHKAD